MRSQSEARMVLVGVIGCGVVGLAIARRLARAGYQVVGIERNRMQGMEVSSRSSEVIHGNVFPIRMIFILK